jgi:hypothetical protein
MSVYATNQFGGPYDGFGTGLGAVPISQNVIKVSSQPQQQSSGGDEAALLSTIGQVAPSAFGFLRDIFQPSVARAQARAEAAQAAALISGAAPPPADAAAPGAFGAPGSFLTSGPGIAIVGGGLLLLGIIAIMAMRRPAARNRRRRRRRNPGSVRSWS